MGPLVLFSPCTQTLTHTHSLARTHTTGKTCNVKLALKTAFSEEGDAYCESHRPYHKPNQVTDTTMQAQINAPDASHGTVEFTKSNPAHQYGSGAVAVDSAISAPKAPTTVQNVSKMEVRHQGVSKFSST
jgi:hypothetical protein